MTRHFLLPTARLVAVFIYFAWGSALQAQRPAQVWDEPTLDSRLEEQTSVVFQGRLTLRTPYRRQADYPDGGQRFHLWLTDGTPAGTDLVLADTVLSNPVVANSQLLFVGVGGAAGSRLLAYDGDTVTPLADINLCDQAFSLQLHDDGLFIHARRTVFHYHLTSQTLQELSPYADALLTDGTIVGLYQFPDGYHFGRIDGRNDGLIVPKSWSPTLHNGRLYYATAAGLSLSDGTIAGTTRVPVPENSPIQLLTGVLGSAGDNLLLLSKTNLVTDTPGEERVLAVTTPDGGAIRVVREQAPVTVDTSTPLVGDPAGLGLFFLDIDDALFYSDGTDAGTQQLVAAPSEGYRVIHQVFHTQADSLLVVQHWLNSQMTTTVYRSGGGTQNTQTIFAENERNIHHIYGQLGNHLLVAYHQTGAVVPNGFLVGLLDPDSGVLTNTDLHPFVIDTVTPLTSFAQAGNVIAVRQGFTETTRTAWLQLTSTATNQSYFLEPRPGMTVNADNGQLFVGYLGDDPTTQPYHLGTWDETTAQVAPLFTFTGGISSASRLTVTQRGQRTGVWTGDHYWVHQAGEPEPTDLFFAGEGEYLGQANGAPIVLGPDRVYIVSPDLSTLTTRSLVHGEPAHGSVDDNYAYVAWNHSIGQPTTFARIMPDSGNIQSFSLPDQNRQVGAVLSLSPQRVLVTQYDTATGTGYLLSINTDTQAVMPLLTLPSACIANGRFALVKAGDRAFFNAFDAATGTELWATDGTVAGTGLVADLYPGPRGANPTFLKTVGETLTFRANHPVQGSSLWYLAPGATTPALLTDGAVSGRVGFRVVGGTNEQWFMTTNERDLWWSQPSFPVRFETPDLVCDDGSLFNVLADAVHPDSQYHWTVTNADIVDGQDTDSLVLRADGNGDVHLEVTVTLGETSQTANTTIPLAPPPPATPGPISGPTRPCALAENQTFSIVAVADATGYEWSVPADATIVSGQDTTQVQVTFANQSGQVQVRATNACGASEWRSLAITLTTDPIVADAGPDRATCDGRLRLAAERPAGTTGFWRILNGDVTLSDNSDPNAVLTFNSPGEATLAWRLQAGACPSAADTVTISYVTGLEMADAGPDQSLCTGTQADLSANQPAWSSNGTWSILAGTGGRLTDSSQPATTLIGQRGERYLLQWRLEGTPCGESLDTVAVVFQGLDGIEAPPNQTINLGDNASLNVVSPRGRGYWEVLLGPNRDRNQFSRIDSPTTRFTPSHIGQYQLRWHETPSNCDPVRVSLWVTVLDAPSFSHRIEHFANPPGPVSNRTYAPGVVTPNGLILREGSSGTTQNLVLTDGVTMQPLLEGDLCTKVYPLPDGGVYAIAMASGGGNFHYGKANLYYRAPGATDFSFVGGRSGLYGCGKTDPEKSVFFGNRLYLTIGRGLYTLDPATLVLTHLVSLNADKPDLFVWQDTLYATGDKLLRLHENTMTFETLWTGYRRTIAPPVARTDSGLFFTTSSINDPRGPTEFLVFSDGSESGTTTLTTERVSGVTTVANLALFHTSRDGYGREPWLSDGTEQGTRLLADIDPGPGSNAAPLVQAFSHAGFAFFFRNSVLWRTDGTETTAFLDLTQLRWFTTVGDDLLLWNGRRLLQTPANGAAAQVTVRYELDFQDQAELDLLAVWQNRVYLQRNEKGLVQVLAAPIDDGPIVTIAQGHRPSDFTATFLGAWDNHMLLIDTADPLVAGNAFTLNRYDDGGAVTPLLQFEANPNPVHTYQIGQTCFFTAGATQTLYRTNGTQAAAVGTPALQHVDGVVKMDQGLLFFAENGDGHRRAYYCSLAGEPQALGDGVQPGQPRNELSATRFHRLGDSAHALFFLETETGTIGLWRWSADRADAALVTQFTPGTARAVVAVAEAQNRYALFQISNRLYRYLATDGQVSEVANGDLHYQGTFQGDAVFLIGESQLGRCDTDGTWHLTDLLEPIDAVLGKSQGFLLVHRPEDSSYKYARLGLTARAPELVSGFANINEVVANTTGGLIFTENREIGVANLVYPEVNQLSRATGNVDQIPFAVTDHTVYFSDVPDTLLKAQQLPLLGERYSYGDDYKVEAFDVFPGSGTGSIQWLQRLGDGTVVCALIPGQGQFLWYVNGFSATRLERGLAVTPNYRVMAGDDTHLVIADIGAPNGMLLHHLSAETTMFPDPIVADFLIAAYDADGNGRLDEQERAAVTDLDLSGLAIQSINGLQFLPNLRRLDLSDNLITDYSPLLEHPSFGQQPDSYLNLSLNLEFSILCQQYNTLLSRMAASEGELVLTTTKAYARPRFNTWPANNVLQLLRPDFVVNRYFMWENCDRFSKTAPAISTTSR